MKIPFRLSVLVALFFAAPLAQALSIFIDETAYLGDKDAKDIPFVFEIKTDSPAKGEVKFHAVITEAGRKFFSATPRIFIGTYIYEENPDTGITHMGFPLSGPVTNIPAVRSGNSVTCDFSISEKALESPNLVLSLSNLADPIPGKDGPFFTPDFYFVRLKYVVLPALKPKTPVAQVPLPSAISLTESDAGKSVSIAKGGEVAITLAGNPTTGFSWALLSGNDTTLKPAGEPVYSATATLPAMAGSGGTFAFKFLALAPGTATLKFGYRRPFEKDVAPAKTFEVTIKVQ